QTGRLVALFIVGVVGTIAAIWIVAVIATALANQRNGGPDWAGAFGNMRLLGGVIGAVLVVVGIASLVKLSQFSQGGAAIAEMLGGRPIEPDTRDQKERELLNIVEEMSIASGVPVPPVYVIDSAGINAFAAGPDPSRSVIGVTRGCMDLLTRDEMQGVVAHEYSHIFHGDTRINARTTAVIAGIMAVGTIGYILFRYVGPTIARSGRGKEKGGAVGAGLAIMLAGVLVWVIGGAGVLVGRLIQAAISRQREFLADAAAVQYTRNPNGIGGALAKIRDHSSRVLSPKASELNHFFFATSLDTLFATHPPIAQRIAAITAMGATSIPEPGATGVGEIMQARRAKADAHYAEKARRDREARSVALKGAAVGLSELVDRGGTMDAESIATARAYREGLSGTLRDAAHAPAGARAICYAIARRPATLAQCDRIVAERDAEAYNTYAAIVPMVEALREDMQLALVDIAAPALFNLGASRYRGFRETLAMVIRSDGQVDLREWALAKCLERHVERRFMQPARDAKERLGSMRGEMRTVIGAIAAQELDDGERRACFTRAFGALGMQSPDFPEPAARNLDALNAAVLRLSSMDFSERARFLKACAVAAAHDGDITPNEYLVMRSVADALDVPVPSLRR
ncbi:MAG: M48 family metallopeptidase, partial [Planctomycetota bacterium]